MAFSGVYTDLIDQSNRFIFVGSIVDLQIILVGALILCIMIETINMKA